MLSGALGHSPRSTSPQTARARLQHDRSRSPTPPYGPRTSMARQVRHFPRVLVRFRSFREFFRDVCSSFDQMKVDSASASGRRWATVVEKLSACAASDTIGQQIGATIRSIYQSGDCSTEWASVAHRTRIGRVPRAVSALSESLLGSHRSGRSIVLVGGPPPADTSIRPIIRIVSVDVVLRLSGPFVLCFGLRGPYDVMHFASTGSPSSEAVQQLVQIARAACEPGGAPSGTGARLIAYVGGDVNELGRTGAIEMTDLDGSGVVQSEAATRVMQSTTASVFTAYPPQREAVASARAGGGGSGSARAKPYDMLAAIKRLQKAVDYEPPKLHRRPALGRRAMPIGL